MRLLLFFFAGVIQAAIPTFDRWGSPWSNYGIALSDDDTTTTKTTSTTTSTTTTTTTTIIPTFYCYSCEYKWHSVTGEEGSPG